MVLHVWYHNLHKPQYTYSVKHTACLKYCNGKPQHLAVCNLWCLWRHSLHYASLKGQLPGRCHARKRWNIPVYLTTTAFSYIRKKETDSTVRRSAVHSRSQTALYKPESHGKWRMVYTRAVSLWGAASRRDGEQIVILLMEAQRMVMRSLHARQWVDGEGAIPRRDSEQMVREPFHGETVSGWRGSHPTARQRADGRGAISRRDSERSADSEGVLSQRYRECPADSEVSSAHKRQNL